MSPHQLWLQTVHSRVQGTGRGTRGPCFSRDSAPVEEATCCVADIPPCLNSALVDLTSWVVSEHPHIRLHAVFPPRPQYLHLQKGKKPQPIYRLEDSVGYSTEMAQLPPGSVITLPTSAISLVVVTLISSRLLTGEALVASSTRLNSRLTCSLSV